MKKISLLWYLRWDVLLYLLPKNIKVPNFPPNSPYAKVFKGNKAYIFITCQQKSLSLQSRSFDRMKCLEVISLELSLRIKNILKLSRYHVYLRLADTFVVKPTSSDLLVQQCSFKPANLVEMSERINIENKEIVTWVLTEKVVISIVIQRDEFYYGSKGS